MDDDSRHQDSDLEQGNDDSRSSEEEFATDYTVDKADQNTKTKENTKKMVVSPQSGLADAELPAPREKGFVSCLIRPFVLCGRGYARARDWIIKTFFSFTLLTAPLLGPLTWHWWAIDINILELLFFGGVFAGITIGGSGSDYGIATGIMTLVVLLPVAKNNIFKYLFGIPFERMIKYHRWAGYYLLVPLFLHALMEAEFLSDYTHITGTIAWGVAVIIVITSFHLMRKYKYEYFRLCHFLFLVFLIVAVMHEPLMLAFILPGLAMYCLDGVLLLMRYWTRSTKTISITQYDESLCKLEVEKRFSYKSGQYAFILVPRVSRWQWHPISFSSAPQERTITFHIRDTGHWSRGINRLSEEESCTIKVEGPYGKVGIPYKKYKVVALFAAGAGITPMMSVLKDIYLRRKMGQRCKIEKVYFYWSAGKAGTVEWFAEDLAYMVNNPLENLEISYNVFVHRMGRNHIQSDAAMQVPLAKGRNNLKANFKTMKKENPGESIGILICGPKQYDYQIRLQCFLQSWTWPWTTKFHYHHETFSW